MIMSRRYAPKAYCVTNLFSVKNTMEVGEIFLLWLFLHCMFISVFHPQLWVTRDTFPRAIAKIQNHERVCLLGVKIIKI